MIPKDLDPIPTAAKQLPSDCLATARQHPNEANPLQSKGQSLATGLLAARQRPNLSLNPDRYLDISIRYAILDILNSLKSNPPTLTEITDFLLQGGVKSSARDFRNVVNTVLAGMRSKREVQNELGKTWSITKTGENLLYFPATKPKKIVVRTRETIPNSRPVPTQVTLKEMYTVKESNKIEDLSIEEIMKKIAGNEEKEK